MEFKILGPLEITASDGSPIHVGGPKQRSLLALLLVNANEVLSKDRIIDALWGDDPPSAGVNALQFHVSKLRSSLGAQGRVMTKGPGYVLEVAPGDLDAERFEAGLTEAASVLEDDPEAAANRYRESLELWRGPALADFEYEDFARTEIARLEELRLTAIEGRFDAELAAGRHDELVADLRSLVGDHPLRERLWGALMTALYRSGRQAEALRAYQEARRILGDELGIEPSPELRDLEDKVLLQDDAMSTPSVVRRSDNLPARVSRFVGRVKEMAAIGKLLGSSRLVTLTGVGGVGKTSLALETVTRHIDEFEEGVWLIDLATVDIPEQVAAVAAEALGVRTRSEERVTVDIIARLSSARSLLIFDNCEHLVATAAELVADLLAACPRVKILATSRELLGVPGEITFVVPRMTLPGDDADDREADSDAVALFRDRIRGQSAAIAYTPEDEETVGRICRALDGLPLAIELAAARTRALSLGELERRLADRFELLAGGSRTAPARQRTLRATVDWSYDLLSPSERWLFAALSVFPAGFTNDALQAVVTAGRAGEDSFELLAALVDKSLVTRVGERYQMLPTLRRYAAGKIDEKDVSLVRRALLTHYSSLAAEIEAHVFGGGSSWVELLRVERSNLRSALAWSIEIGETDAALDLAAALALYWTQVGLWADSQLWLRRASVGADDVPQTVQLREGLLHLEGISEPDEALAALAHVAGDRGEHRRAARLLGVADAIRREHGRAEPEELAGLAMAVRAHLGQEEFEEAWGEGDALVSRG